MYRIEVKTKDGWRYLRPTGGSPYTYKELHDAVAVAKMCYPDAWREQLLGGECTVDVVRVDILSELADAKE